MNKILSIVNSLEAQLSEMANGNEERKMYLWHALNKTLYNLLMLDLPVSNKDFPEILRLVANTIEISYENKEMK